MPLSREIQLAARPVGEPTESTFALATTEVPDPVEGEVLVRNLWMSVDPYMRGRMNDTKSYIPPFQVGAALEGGAVGEVISSQSATHQVGIHHIAFGVADFTAAYQALAAKGIQFIGPHYEAPDGGTCLDFFLDPEGNRLQLVYRRQPLGT